MGLIETLVVIVHVLVAFAVIGLVMIQQGKGADAGAAFGGGASQTVFGSQGGLGFLVKVTAGLAFLFFASSFALAVFAKQKAESLAAEPGIPAIVQEQAPAAPASTDPVAPVTLEAGEPAGDVSGEEKKVPATLE